MINLVILGRLGLDKFIEIVIEIDIYKAVGSCNVHFIKRVFFINMMENIFMR